MSERSNTHSIRLREPWGAEWTQRADGATIATYTRSFHQPTGIVAGQVMMLAVLPIVTESEDWSALYFLKGCVNGSTIAFSLVVRGNLLAPINEPLQPFNRLTLSMPHKKLMAFLGRSAEEVGDVPPPLTDVFDVQLMIGTSMP